MFGCELACLVVNCMHDGSCCELSCLVVSHVDYELSCLVVNCHVLL